jgi:hypothetical protein
MCSPVFPLELRDVDAAIELSPGRFALAGAEASCVEGGLIRMNGIGGWDESNASFEGGASATEVMLSRDLVAALPQKLAAAFAKLSPRGRLNAELRRLRLAKSTGGVAWSAEGTLALRDAALTFGMAMDQLEGELSGACRITAADELELRAALSLGHGRIAGRPVQRWEGQLRKDIGSRWVRIDDLRGRICDGEAIGSLAIDPLTSEYELELTVENAAAGGFLGFGREPGDAADQGRLSGSFHVRGRAGDDSSRAGGGDLRIIGASFLRTPILRNVAEAGRNRAGELSDTVDRADLSFVWHGSELILNRVDISSRDLRLVGQGTLDLRGETVHLDLVGAHPLTWPRVAVLTDVVESAGQDLIGYRVDGPVSKPAVKAEPLHRLTDAVRRLLGEP